MSASPLTLALRNCCPAANSAAALLMEVVPTSCVRDPWVEPAIDKVDQQVGEHVREGRQENNSLHHGVIAVADRLYRQPPHSGPGEHGLGDDRALNKTTELKSDHCNDGHERVLQCVDEDHTAPR